MCKRRIGCVLIVSLLLVCIVAVAAAAAVYRFAGASGACRRAMDGPAEPGLSARTLTSGGLERCYLLYVPAGYDPARPMPLVLSLHGFASPPEGQRFLARWDPIADREGFIVAYPQGTGFPLRWNAFGANTAGQVDDVQFIRDLLNDVSRLATVDAARIYSSGMSNGGAMTHRLACELADSIAAAGVVAGPAVAAPCTPSRPVPVIAFFGTADRVVSYQGGRVMHGGRSETVRRLMGESLANAQLMPAEEWIAGWAARNGCNLTPDPVPPRGDVSGMRYSGCQAGADVVFYRIEGGGHTWPGGPSIPLGKTSRDINASEAMWEFFTEHPLP